MKTVLVMSSSLEKSMPQTKWQQPLGLAYIAACIRDISDVSIIDCEIEENYERKLINEIDTGDKLLVGISANTYSYPEALKLAKTVKELNPDSHISLGGYHPTPLSKQILTNREYVDSVIRGDGEIAFRQLVTAISRGDNFKNVQSLTYRNSGITISNENASLLNLDDLPYPARDLLPMDKCFSNFSKSFFKRDYGLSRAVYVNANRGCPNKCNFCCLFNKQWRPRDPNKIVDEFEYVKEKYQADTIYLVGDNINLNKKWFLSLCDAIIERNLGLKWISTSTYPSTIDENVLSKMVDSGCIRAVALGIESGSQEMLDSMNKKTSIKVLNSLMRMMKRFDIDILASFILGAPGETTETLSKTLDFIESSSITELFASILTPLPGSAIYEKMLEIIPELRHSDNIDLDRLRRDYVKYFCNVEYEELKRMENKIRELSNLKMDIF